MMGARADIIDTEVCISVDYSDCQTHQFDPELSALLGLYIPESWYLNSACKPQDRISSQFSTVYCHIWKIP